MQKNVPSTRRFFARARRNRALRHALRWLLAVGSLGTPWAGPARAQSAASPARPSERISAQLQLEAPASCATSAALRERVALRSTRLELTAAAQGVPAVRITIQPGRPEVTARLSLVWPDGHSAERTLTAARCAQVVDALALLLVLALDPDAREVATGSSTLGSRAEEPRASTRSSRAEEPRASTADPGAEASTQPTTSEPQHADSAAQQLVEPPADKNVSEPPPARAGYRRERISLGALAKLITGVTPGPMPGVGAELQVAWLGTTPWSPALSLAFVHAFRSGLRQQGGVADFLLDEAVLDVCPLALRSGPWIARGCLSGALGSLSAEGSETYSRASARRLWSSLGASVFGSLDLSRWFALELRAGLGAPLSRPSFAFAPQVFHRVAALTFDVQLAFAARFW